MFKTIFAFTGWTEYKEEGWINCSVWGPDWASEFTLETYWICQASGETESGMYVAGNSFLAIVVV